AEIGLPDQAIGWALAGFAAGVEIGQVLFLLGFVALLALVARVRVLRARVPLCLAYAVGAAGAFLFLDRIGGSRPGGLANGLRPPTGRKESLEMFRKIASVMMLLFFVVLSSSAFANEKVNAKRHVNLAAAQTFVKKAIAKLTTAQEKNEFDMD